MAEPTFYRTRRADFEVVDQLLDATPDRTLNLEIPAHPFGYGLPVTDSFTITNDPTTGTNKMQAEFPAIQGDVLTPLHLSFPTPDAAHRVSWASEALPTGAAPAAPYYKSLPAQTIDASPLAGWTITDAADATMVSGNRRRLTGSASQPMVPTASTVLQWASLPPGDYLVFVRVGQADVDTEILFFNRPPANGATYTRADAAAAKTVDTTHGTAGHDWFDLGVVAMPGGGPIPDGVFGLDGAAMPALWNVGVYKASGSVTIDLDAVVLVPAGRPGTQTRHGWADFPGAYTSKDVILDGVNGRWYAEGESTLTAGVTTRTAPSNVSGTLPVVVPGADNVLTLFASTASTAAARIDDDKALTTLVTWSYFPRHLYDRPDPTP